MSSAVRPSPARLPATPWGRLPPRMKVLFIRGPHRTGGWLAEAFAADSASEIRLMEAEGVAAGLAELRDEMYDAVLISQEAHKLDALDLLDAIRAGSRDRQPIVVLGEEDEHAMAALCYEAGADAYVCVRTATIRGLIWQVARAVERHALLAENRRLDQARQTQLQREREEAERMIGQQRELLAALPDIGPVAQTPVSNKPVSQATEAEALLAGVPDGLVSHYRELLRTYVMMGSGNLAPELRRLAGRLAAAPILPRQVMALHVSVVERMVAGLGNRSARHVMNRAEILILEVLVNLAECYRQSLGGNQARGGQST